MVAESGRGWRLAPSLIALIDQADRLWPRRSRVSDGSIGDPAHASRVSDHNPSGGYVHAIDITHDPRIFNAHVWADQVRNRRDPRVNYIISNRRICSASDGWRWRSYTGQNPHDSHVHVSIHHTHAARMNTGSWFAAVNEEDDLTPEQDQLLRNIAAAVARLEKEVAIEKQKTAAQGLDLGKIKSALGV